MKVKTKVWLVAAASFVVIGSLLFAGTMTMAGWDFRKLSTVHYETNIYSFSEGFDSISMHTDTADIEFAHSEDGTCSVVCYEEENAKHSVTVENGILTVTLPDDRSLNNFIGHIGVHFGSPKITVYLPEAEYTSLYIREDTGNVVIPESFTFENMDIALSTGDVDLLASVSEQMQIQTSTGDIRVENISAGALDLSASTGHVTVSNVICEGTVKIDVSTGKVFLTDIACKSVISSGSTGNITLDRVTAAETFSIRRSTGDVSFDRSDAAEILVETDTGDVTGTLLTDKIFITQTDTGSVAVPKTTTGGRCEISTDTGDIQISN